MTHKCSSNELCAEFLDAVEALAHSLRSSDHTTDRDSEGYCDMPATCGSTAWAMLHGTVEAFRDHVCASCGEHGVKLLSFAHDVVNLARKVPLYDQKNFHEVLSAINELTSSVKDFKVGGALSRTTNVRQESGFDPACERSAVQTQRRFVEPSGQELVPAPAAELGVRRKPSVDKQDFREYGFVVCELPNGKFVNGPTAVGDDSHVNVPISCPTGSKRAAVFHEHPPGNPEPSDFDVKGACKIGIPRLAIGQGKKVFIYRLKCDAPEKYVLEEDLP